MNLVQPPFLRTLLPDVPRLALEDAYHEEDTLVVVLRSTILASPLAGFPVFYMRYIAMLIMVLATFGALLTYVRGRLRFRYGSPGTAYRVVLLSLGVIAASTALGMGWMKSNSRAPYTIYNQPAFTVESEEPPSGFGR